MKKSINIERLNPEGDVRNNLFVQRFTEKGFKYTNRFNNKNGPCHNKIPWL